MEWEEFFALFKELGLDLSDDDIAEWQTYADTDQSGCVSWEEFEICAEELIRKFYSDRHAGDGEEVEGERPAEAWVSSADKENEDSKKACNPSELHAEPGQHANVSMREMEDSKFLDNLFS